MRRDEVVAQLHRPHPPQGGRDGQRVAQRLGHLLTRERHPAVVQPVAGEAVARGAGLRTLVLVVREHQVQTAAVDVERLPEVGSRHRRALQVPPRPATAPRRRPGRLTGLGRLPQGEVPRGPLAGRSRLPLDRFPLDELVRPLARERPVVRERPHVEVDVAVRGVGVPGGDQAIHQLDHLRHVAGGAGQRRGRQATEPLVGILEGPLVDSSPFPPWPSGVRRLGEDLVVDVGDVADQQHVVPVGFEPAAQHIEVQHRAHVPDVRHALHRRAADVDRRRGGPQRRELPQASGRSVEQAHAVMVSDPARLSAGATPGRSRQRQHPRHGR